MQLSNEGTLKNLDLHLPYAMEKFAMILLARSWQPDRPVHGQDRLHGSLDVSDGNCGSYKLRT